MNLTDVEDKAIREAARKKSSIESITQANIEAFIHEMNLLRMRVPNYMPRAFRAVDQAVDIILRLIDLGVSYWHKGNVYLETPKYVGFGELYGLGMTRWPAKRKRFHKDTYRGMRWIRGDFIL